MSIISFVKYQGAGNDFILLDDRVQSFDPARVASLCHRKFGIGADGVVLLQEDLTADFRMRIYNSDGTEAAMCGNGLRCLMQFLLDLGFSPRVYQIRTQKEILTADYREGKIWMELGKVLEPKLSLLNGTQIYSLNTGVPHAVLFVPDVQKIDLQKEAPPIRHHASFGPEGTNVNFASIQKDGSIQVRTFERGVEGETLSCGTGAAAVGLLASRYYNLPSPVTLHFAGGILQVDIQGSTLSLLGEAQKVFSGTLSFV
jgi:diaminopimelate epimerase